jgi:hypothetical protein
LRPESLHVTLTGNISGIGGNGEMKEVSSIFLAVFMYLEREQIATSTEGNTSYVKYNIKIELQIRGVSYSTTYVVWTEKGRYESRAPMVYFTPLSVFQTS